MQTGELRYFIRLAVDSINREDAWDLCRVAVQCNGGETHDGCFAFRLRAVAFCLGTSGVPAKRRLPRGELLLAKRLSISPRIWSLSHHLSMMRQRLSLLTSVQADAVGGLAALWHGDESPKLPPSVP